MLHSSEQLQIIEIMRPKHIPETTSLLRVVIHPKCPTDSGFQGKLKDVSAKVSASIV